MSVGLPRIWETKSFKLKTWGSFIVKSENSKDYMSHSQEGNCLIVQVKNRFDERNCFQIQDNISNLLSQTPSHLLLDLNDVRIIRSSGLRVILSLAKSFQSKTETFALIYSKDDANYQVSQILQISGFTKIVEIFSTKESALDFCSKSAD